MARLAHAMKSSAARTVWSIVAVAAISIATLGAAAGAGAAQEATPESSKAISILRDASARIAEIEGAHFTLAIEGDTYVDSSNSIRLLEAEGDLARPDRVRTTFKAEVLVATVTIELITIGDQSWTTNLITGNWEPAPPEFQYSPAILFDDKEGIGPVMDLVKTATLEDDEEIRDRDTYHISTEVDESAISKITAGTMVGSPVVVELWIDKETSDLLRARLTEPVSEERENPAIWTLDLFDHGTKVEIEPPI